jgi:glycosyltransferase involved in cell wall biosynthesis
LAAITTHILIALQRYEAGGAERQALFLARGLQQAGYQVSIIAFGKAQGLAWQRFQEAGISCHSFNFSEKLLLPGSANFKATYLRWKYRRRLIKKVRELKVNIIIPFTYRPNIIFGLIWKKTGARKCFWNQRDGGIFTLGYYWEVRALENCRAIISNSAEGKLFLSRFTKRPVIIIHNGIESPPDQLAIKPDTADQIRVVMVANLTVHKDHLTLLKAWQQVLKVTSQTVELILVGKEGSAYPAVRQFIDENRLQDSVKITGQVSDVYSFLSICQVAVFSSVKEGLPNGVLECMAVGLPVVATRITGTQEALGEDYPFLAEPKNPDDFAHLVSLLIHDPKLREETGKKNRKRAEQLFGIDRMVNEYLKIIQGE